MDIRHRWAKTIDSILFSLVIGFACGIVLESFVLISPAMLASMAGLGFVLLVFSGFSLRHKILLLSLSVVLFSSLLGIYRAQSTKPDANLFKDAVGTTIIVQGIITDEPAMKSFTENFTIKTNGVGILVSTKNTSPFAYGDDVTVKGTLELPQNFMTDQGTEFDYVSYLYKDDILYQMKNAAVTVRSHGNGNLLVAHLIPVKNKILESFKRVLPAKEADLLAGLDLGEKSSIDKNFRGDLVTTGTIHMIALSGYNVSIIASALRDFLTDILGLSSRIAGLFGAIGIVIFVVMTGLQSSAVRAGIMALIALFARGRGHTYDAFRALIFAGFLMVLWNPKYLVYDVSFELSFLATLGIIFITPILEQKFVRVPKKLVLIIPLRELISVTLGAQLGVLPFILYKMGTLSIISLPANMFVLPAVPFAMGFGALAGLIGMFSADLAYPVAWVTHILLRYIKFVVTFFAHVPYASVVIKHFPVFFCLLLYLILFAVVYRAWSMPDAAGVRPVPTQN